MGGAPEFLLARLAEYNEGNFPEYVSMGWNVELWLSELDELGCDPASLNKLLHLNKLDPKLANKTVILFFMRTADGFNPLASPVDNNSAWLMTTCSSYTMTLEDWRAKINLIQQ